MSTTTSVIPREQWRFFCDTFSRQHRGWPAVVNIVGANAEPHTEVNFLPFEGVSAVMEDGESSISLTLGEGRGQHLTRTIADPARIVVGRCISAACAFEVLEVEDGEGTKTLLRFKAQVLQEMLDGLF
jgi:hypothetical protein